MNAYIVIYAGYGMVVYIDCMLQLLSNELLHSLLNRPILISVSTLVITYTTIELFSFATLRFIHAVSHICFFVFTYL